MWRPVVPTQHILLRYSHQYIIRKRRCPYDPKPDASFQSSIRMYWMGRLASIQPMTSAILKILSHSVILLRREGPFYSIYDWQRSRARISEIGAPIGAPVFQITAWLPFQVLSRASGPLFRYLSSTLSAPLFREPAVLLCIPESAAHYRGLKNVDIACKRFI